jgi:hypothetical protein
MKATETAMTICRIRPSLTTRLARRNRAPARDPNHLRDDPPLRQGTGQLADVVRRRRVLAGEIAQECAGCRIGAEDMRDRIDVEDVLTNVFLDKLFKEDPDTASPKRSCAPCSQSGRY